MVLAEEAATRAKALGPMWLVRGHGRDTSLPLCFLGSFSLSLSPPPSLPPSPPFLPPGPSFLLLSLLYSFTSH